MAIYTSAYTQSQIDEAIGKIFAYSGGNSDNVRIASQIGLIPNDSTKGSANGAIIASLITAGKSLFMDKDEVYYINGSSWEIGYEFSIKGKATLACTGKMFKPIVGSSLYFDGITFTGSPSVETYLINNDNKVDYQINTISLINCKFSGLIRVMNLRGKDQDYSVTPFGISRLTILNCQFININSSQIILEDMVISDGCTLKDCFIDKMVYTFFSIGTTNEYTYANANKVYDGDFIIDNNIVTGTVQEAGYTYYSFVTAELNRLIYTNNTVTNLIGLGSATYDMYSNSIETIYEGNVIRNVCNLPPNSGTTLYTEVFKSKGSTNNTARNNHWVFDFDECRQMVSDLKGVTYTDERFAEISKVKMFDIVTPSDVVFCNNKITVRGGTIEAPYSSRTIRKMSFCANVLEVDGAINGYILPVWNSSTQEIIATDNVFHCGNTEQIKLFGTAYDLVMNNTNNVRIVCKNNDSSTPILNIGCKGSEGFIFSDNTYKTFPSISENQVYTFDGSQGTEQEMFCASGDKYVRVYNFGKSYVKAHCSITSAGSYIQFYLPTDFDFYIPATRKSYKIRNEEGTIVLYDGNGGQIATISSSYATIISDGNMQMTALYSSSDNEVRMRYYNAVGLYDIEFAGISLGKFDNLSYSSVGFFVNPVSNSSPTVSLDGTIPVHVVTTTVAITGLSLSINPSEGHSCHVILSAASELGVTVVYDATNRVTPNAANLTVTIPAGGYTEVDFFKANGKVYVRGV